MKLCIIGIGSAFKTGPGAYQTRDTFPLYVNALSGYFSKIILFMPVYQSNNNKIPFVWRPSKGVEVVEGYPVSSVVEFYLNLPKLLMNNALLLSRCIKESDVVLLRVPALNVYMGYLISKILNKGIVAYVIGRQKELVFYSRKYKGLKKILALAMAALHELNGRRIVRNSNLNIFLGSNLAETYGQPIGQNQKNHFGFTSLIAEEDIIVREGDLRGGSCQLLYVGRLLHEKGIQYLIKAVRQLISEGCHVHLEIVGDDKDEIAKQEFMHLVNQLELESYIKFRGFIAHGEELNRIFLNSDFFVLPSTSEGIPKVILEAMAKGLPVIATNVGGIPDIIRDRENGFLVPPESPEAIAQAVQSLLRDEELRKRIVGNAYTFIRRHTVNKMAYKLATLICDHFD